MKRKVIALIVANFFFGAQAAFAGDTAWTTGDRGSGAYEVYVITSEGLKVGNGTPGTTMDGEDAYVEGTFEVDGAVKLDGAITATSSLTVQAASGTVTAQGTENTEAAVLLQCDDSDDGGDDWTIKSNPSDNSFTVGIDTPTAGTPATKLKIDQNGEVTMTAYEGTDASVTLQADESDDNGDDWKIEADQATNSLMLKNDTSGSQVAKVTLTTGGIPLFAGASMGSTDSQGNVNYEVIVTTVMIDTADFPLTLADGKAGSFIVIIGTYTVTGSFTSAAAVTLGLSSTETGTSNGTDAKVNVYDGGTIVYVENQSGGTATATIRYSYVN